VHALADPRHHGGGKVKDRIQYFFRNSFFPGVRQALIHSGLTISHDGNRDADQFFFTFSQQVGGMSVMVVLAKVCAFRHAKLLKKFNGKTDFLSEPPGRRYQESRSLTLICSILVLARIRSALRSIAWIPWALSISAIAVASICAIILPIVSSSKLSISGASSKIFKLFFSYQLSCFSNHRIFSKS